LVIEYPTKVNPAADDRARRGKNRERIERLLQQISPGSRPVIEHLDPYSIRAARAALTREIERTDAEHLIIDVSCLTKIHAIALSDPTVFSRLASWEVAYSVPETYGHVTTSKEPTPGWRDVLILPVSAAPGPASDADARGVILTGHEGDRLIVALAELEPAAGVIVTAQAARRPDLRRESERRNEAVLRRLRGRGASQWRQEVVELRDARALATAIGNEISKSRDTGSPVVLFPFGPKPFVFLAAMQLAAQPNSQAWFVYPIPNSYDVDYSYGTGRTVWFCRATNQEESNPQQRLALQDAGREAAASAKSC
jgi:hypothetical protein